ncbi:MAG: ABC transporter ATP-binding protein/permease [Oscillospiraceae bacterium]|nr:ABC transporter ATP-binding protein/permease [Oscillospiraceae bacterium]
MLELKNVTKTYRVGEIETKALRGVSMAFRSREFVAILGASGSGKTTCLNIIGGLDRYDDGEMTIKGKKTTTFKDKDWDAYRNNSVGFVFQSYNLISHLGIVANVELGMTLSGVSAKEKRQRAIEVLTEVGLKDHLHKKPSQLSGGQMQRVAIARALANNPEILMCDEPTGALDTKTSKQIMNLIRDLSKERLVIMVTHNPEIAQEYADRIIRFDDGLVESDSNPHVESLKDDEFSLKKTAMSFITALNLSGNNILTKKGRTFLTAFASSIGIIGIAVILSLSNGFQMQIDKFQEDALAEFPILISREKPNIDEEEFKAFHDELEGVDAGPLPTEITVFDPTRMLKSHTNKFTDEYIDYINDIDTDIASYIGYQRMLSVNALRRDDGKVASMTFPTIVTMMTGGVQLGGDMMGGSMGLSSFPKSLGEDDYMQSNFELLDESTMRWPSSPTDLLMVVGSSGRIELSTLEALGYDTDRCTHECNCKNRKKHSCGYVCKCVVTLSFDEIMNTEFKLIDNDDYYFEIDDLSELMGNMKLLPNLGLGNIADGTNAGVALERLVTQFEDDFKDVVRMMRANEKKDDENDDAEDDTEEEIEIDLSHIPPEYLAGTVLQDERGTLIIGAEGMPIAMLMQMKDMGNIVVVIDPMNPEGDPLAVFPNMGGDSDDDKAEQKLFIPATEYKDAKSKDEKTSEAFWNKLWDADKSLSLQIVGIVRVKDPSNINLMLDGIVYSDELLELVIERASDSDIVLAQKAQEGNVLPGTERFTTAELLHSMLGGTEAIGAITIYPTSFEKKDLLLEYLDEWNEMHENEEDHILYTDLAGMIMSFMSNIISAITVVLIAFASISLVVSLIMIAIITYVSVLERTKEIGILRALGARKKDITRVFDAETFIIGGCSGLIGVIIAYLLTIPANIIIEDMTDLANVAQLNVLHAIMLLILSTGLTVLGGHLPARMAAQRDAVEALRSD